MNPRHLRHTRCQNLFLFPPRLWQSKRKKPNFFCKERLWVYNYVMHKTKIIQKDYSLSSMNYQLKLPFELEVLIPDITIANPEKESRASCTATKLPSSVQLCHPPEAHLSRGATSLLRWPGPPVKCVCGGAGTDWSVPVLRQDQKRPGDTHCHSDSLLNKKWKLFMIFLSFLFWRY